MDRHELATALDNIRQFGDLTRPENSSSGESSSSGSDSSELGNYGESSRKIQRRIDVAELELTAAKAENERLMANVAELQKNVKDTEGEKMRNMESSRQRDSRISEFVKSGIAYCEQLEDLVRIDNSLIHYNKSFDNRSAPT